MAPNDSPHFSLLCKAQALEITRPRHSVRPARPLVSYHRRSVCIGVYARNGVAVAGWDISGCGSQRSGRCGVYHRPTAPQGETPWTDADCRPATSSKRALNTATSVVYAPSNIDALEGTTAGDLDPILDFTASP